MDDKSADNELHKILEIVHQFGTHELPMWYVNMCIFRFSGTVCSKSDLERWLSGNDVSCEFKLRRRKVGKRVTGEEEFVLFSRRK